MCIRDREGITARVTAAPEPERIDTSKLSDAKLDAMYEQRRREREAAGKEAGAEAALAVPLALNVRRLNVRDARVESRDPESGEVSVVELRTLQASGLNLEGRPIPLSLSLAVPGEQELRVALDGELRIAQDDDQVSFDGLQIEVSGATEQPLSLVLTGALDLSRIRADTQLELNLGDASGCGTLVYSSFESPQIDAELHMNLFDPALLALAGPEAAATGEQSTGGSGDEPLPLDAIRAIDTRASLRIDNARFGAHNIENLAVQLRALEGVVELRELSGSLHGGELDGTATFDGKHNTATLDTQGALQGLDIATALAAMEYEPILSGGASLDWQLTSRGRTVNELTAALKGPLTLQTADVVLHDTSVEKLLCQGVALTNNERLTTQFPTDTSFTAISANIDIDQGVARLQPLHLDLAQAKLSGAGDFQLLSQDFDVTFRAKLLPELEELDRACRVSKRLTAIDFPVVCKGSTGGEPGEWCRVDTEEILRDLAVNEGRRKIEKKAGKFFNKLLGGDKD